MLRVRQSFVMTTWSVEFMPQRPQSSEVVLEAEVFIGSVKTQRKSHG